jgi:LDH2 family malate/lactate/ureidoglycolate dehydrogenase
MENFMVDTFMAYGVDQENARVAASVLAYADRRGIDTHGIGRLKPIYCDRFEAGIINPTVNIQVERETATTALLDANLSLGLAVGPYAMRMAINKAKEHGCGFVAVKNSTHFGVCGYYADMAAEEGCMSWNSTNARPSIAPTNSVDPFLGTNPMCIGVPSGEDFPCIIDTATSITQRGKIEKLSREGKPTPYGQVMDRQGNIRTDTDQILLDLVTKEACLLPVGDYKGYGWALLAELLSSAI